MCNSVKRQPEQPRAYGRYVDGQAGGGFVLVVQVAVNVGELHFVGIVEVQVFVAEVQVVVKEQRVRVSEILNFVARIDALRNQWSQHDEQQDKRQEGAVLYVE